MSRYDELEHEGDELFSFHNRKDEADVKKQIELKKDKIKVDIQDQRQKEWLSVDNPYIWDGNFDA